MYKVKIKHQLFVLFLVLPAIFLACTEDTEFKPIKSGPFTLVNHELNGISVNELVIKGDWIFAATTNGVFGKNLNVSGAKFLPLGLQNNDVLDIHPFTVTEILASAVNLTSGDTDAKIYQTLNGGENWCFFDNDFGGQDLEIREALSDFEAAPDQPNVLYAAGQYSVAKSVNKGKTWELLWGLWQGFAQPTMSVAVNPLLTDEIWAGGQGGIEDGYLVRLKNGEEADAWYDLVPNPTVVKRIVFDKENPQSIYVGWEGELTKTMDNGKTWQTLINARENSDFFYGIGLSPNISTRVYAGRWLKAKEQQKLEIYYSEDKGVTWDSEEFPQIAQGGIWDLKVTQLGNKDRIFLGLDKGGIVEVINDNAVTGLNK